MFKSTQDYNCAIYKVLTTIRDTNSFPNPNTELDECDLGDVVNFCNCNNYVNGIDIVQNALGYYIYSGQPRLTYEGLNFIEQFN